MMMEKSAKDKSIQTHWKTPITIHLISHYFLSLSRSASHSLLSALFLFCARVYFQPNELIHIHHTFSSRKYERSPYSKFDSTFLNLAELSSCVFGNFRDEFAAYDRDGSLIECFSRSSAPGRDFPQFFRLHFLACAHTQMGSVECLRWIFMWS